MVWALERVSLVRGVGRHIHENNTSPWALRLKPYDVGCEDFVLQGDRMMVGDRSRRSVGWRTSALLHRSMRSRALVVYRSLKEIQKQEADWKLTRILKPDARFFNAALDLFSRQPIMRPRKARVGQAHWKRHLRFTNSWYARSGTVPRCWNPLLQEVAEDLVEAGYSVPLGLRHLFVGRWPQGTLQYDHLPQLERRAFAFPSVRKHFQSHSIPTHKNRGLPLGRQLRRLGRRGTHSTMYMQNYG
jgi:hypothetical protein